MEKIKELREKTGAGMVECKKALDETGGNIDQAIEILRKKGIAKAGKRSDRRVAEGIILCATSPDDKEGYMVELNAETDFVARNEKFKNFGNSILGVIKEKKPVDLETLKNLSVDGVTVQESLAALSGTVGEKMAISRFSVLKSAGTVAAYSHLNGKIGVLAAIDKPLSLDLAYDIAMQIAALDPKYISPEDVPDKEISKEKEIYTEQLIKEGKKKEMIEKIIPGKLNKYFEEICLLKQEYIKDDKKRVADILKEIKVEDFVRYSLSGGENN